MAAAHGVSANSVSGEINKAWRSRRKTSVKMAILASKTNENGGGVGGGGGGG